MMTDAQTLLEIITSRFRFLECNYIVHLHTVLFSLMMTDYIIRKWEPSRLKYAHWIPEYCDLECRQGDSQTCVSGFECMQTGR